jgi:hypothetical protein
VADFDGEGKRKRRRGRRVQGSGFRRYKGENIQYSTEQYSIIKGTAGTAGQPGAADFTDPDLLQSRDVWTG